VARRHRLPVRWPFGCAVGTLLLVVSVSAEEPRSAPLVPDQVSRATHPIGGPAGPDTYLLPDKDGKLQKVLGFRYEDFVQAYKMNHGLAETVRKPRYSLQRFVVTGRAADGYAELHVEIGIVLDAEGPIGVPIGLGRALLRGPPTYDGPDLPLVHFDTTAGAYVVWVEGAAEKVQRTLALDLLVPLATAGEEHILRLAAPRAAASRLTLLVQLSDARARVGEESVLVATRDAKPGTELTVTGLDGQFELGWQPDGRSPVKPSTVLEATGAILARLDGQRVITEATVTVRGFGGTFDRFVMRLPPGGELVAVSDPSYTVLPAPAPTASKSGKARGQRVEIRLHEATAGPVEVHCVVQQPCVAAAKDEDPRRTPEALVPRRSAIAKRTPAKRAAGKRAAGKQTPAKRTPAKRAVGKRTAGGGIFELGGFDVVGAVQQSGYVAVDVIGDWYVQWGSMVGAIRVEDLPEQLRHGEHVAGFQYFRQPFSLRGRVVPRRTRVRVEPEYLLLVGAGGVELTARLRYRVRVKNLLAVELDLPGWEIEPGSIGPDEIFDIEATTATDQGPLRIPLRSPRQGSFSLQFKARPTGASDRERIDLALPIPVHCVAVPSAVVVLPDDNVQLVPQSGAMVGLTPERIAPPVDLPPRQQAAFYYQGDPEKTRFVAIRHTHPRVVTGRVSARLMVHADRVRVEQTLSLDVAYEPLESVAFRVPGALRPGDQIEFRMGGQRLHATFSEPVDAEVPALPRAAETEPQPSPATGPPGAKRSKRSNMVLAHVTLPKPTIGSLQVVAHYEFPRQIPPAGATQAERLPLLVPCDSVEQTAVTLEVQPPWQIAVADDAWSEQKGGHDQAALAGASPPIVAEGPRPFVPVHVRRVDSLLPPTVVGRLWVQTWLGDGVRRDRAVYRFERSGPQWTFSLPAGTRRDRVVVTRNGQIVAVTVNRRNQLIVPAGDDASDRSCCLELVYEVACERLRGPLTIDLPTLVGNPWIRQTFWELVLPENLHLVGGPEPFTREYVWEMNQFFWTRRPALGTRELEAWAGASSELPMPAHVHRYLFSRLGAVDHVTVWTASRAMLVLVSSGLVLVMGLLWMYRPGIRRIGLLFVFAVLLMGLGMADPDLVLLFLQASMLGIALVFLAAVLRRLGTRREPDSRTVVHSGGSSIVTPITTTQIHLPAASGGDTSSASTRITPSLPTSESC